MTGRCSHTVAMLYPGELGAQLATLLLARGIRVVTSTQCRSERTMARAERAGLEILPSLEDVVRCGDIVISLVPPAAAVETAAAWCSLSEVAPDNALYVDGNSVGPEIAINIASRVKETGHDFVDAAISGAASNLASGGTIFLSGTRAGDVADVIGGVMRTEVLGDEPGRASTMKMMLSGLSKGLCALFAETALLAKRHEMLDEMMAASARIYPGVMAVVDRMLPTYVQHAARRADETREMEATAQAAGLQPCMLRAIRELHAQLARISFDRSGEKVSVSSVIEQLHAQEMLSGDKSTR